MVTAREIDPHGPTVSRYPGWKILKVFTGKRALGLNNWIDPSVESLGEFYWGDENADDAGLPGLWFP
jgi:hypothetical protein